MKRALKRITSSNCSGVMQDLENPRLYYYINGKIYYGKNIHMSGDCDYLHGDCTNLAGICDCLEGDCSGLRGDASDIYGNIGMGMRGVVSVLQGNITGLTGDCSYLYGNCSGVLGDCSGVYGDCTNIEGDFDGCEISYLDRIRGIDIEDLVETKHMRLKTEASEPLWNSMYMNPPQDSLIVVKRSIGSPFIAESNEFLRDKENFFGLGNYVGWRFLC